MSDTVVYMRGNIPFPREQLVSSDVVEDAKLVLAIEPEVLISLSAELEAFPSFLDKPAIQKIAAGYLSDSQAAGITRLILVAESRLRSSGIEINDLLAAVKESKYLSLGEFEQLESRLPLILRRFPGLKRQAKAKHLSQVLGQAADSVEVICDLRPIFDETRTEIEGIIPFTTLKVVCSGADGLPVSFEAVLTERELVRLAQKTTAATQKLRYLRELMTKKSFTIPALDMTKGAE